MKDEKRTIICGINGCIVSTNGDVSIAHLESLKQISEWMKGEGLKVLSNIVLCTGENSSYVQAIANFLGPPDCWAVIEHGAFLFNPSTGEKISNPAITPEAKSQFREILCRKVISRILERHPVELCPGNEICLIFKVKYKKLSEGTIVKCRYDILEEVYKTLRKEREIQRLIKRKMARFFQSSWNVGLIPCTKISGLRYLAKIEGINLSASLGIGSFKEDSFLKILRYIGCPANASDVCKTLVRKKRGRVSHYTYAQGIVDIIEYFFPDLAQK